MAKEQHWTYTKYTASTVQVRELRTYTKEVHRPKYAVSPNHT